MTEESLVELRLSCQPLSNDKYVIGNVATKNFLEVPSEFIYILEYADGVNTIKGIQEKIYEKYDQFIDVLDVMNFLCDEKLIYSCDGKVIGKDNKIEYNRILKKIADCIFSKFMIGIFTVLLGFVIYSLLFGKEIHIDSINIIQGKPGCSLLIFLVISWFITLFHELGHYLSGVKLGINVNLKLSMRFCYLVAESNINGIWAVDKKQRDICYLGGIFFESILATVCILIQKTSMPLFVFKMTDLILLIISMNMLWQFMISMRTDLYLIILNHLGVSSLHAVSIQKLKEMLRNRFLEKMTLYNKLYIVTWIVGGIFSIAYYLFSLRIYIQLGKSMYSNFLSNSVDYLDTFFLAIFVLVSVTCWLIGFQNKVREKV